jgi:tRNA pseudouridine55 synthase
MIRRVKKAFYPAKLGHSGTLDPMASGLLILLVGSATKRQSQIIGLPKTYRGTLKLGIKTDSADMMGNVIDRKPIPAFDRACVEKVFRELTGEIRQIPPMYAAIKKDGVPLYKLARKDIQIEREPRLITIHSLELIQMGEDQIEFRVHCSSGTYVRTLVEDIAEKLGTVATLAALEREAIGPYSLSAAVAGDNLRTMTSEELWQKVAS